MMKKQRTVFLAVVMLAVTFFSTTTFAINGDMGNFTEPQTDGSEAYPYLIEDFADFQVFADPANKAIYWATGVHTRLDCDIDLDPALAGRQIYATAVIAANVDITQRYEGLFDGNGRTVRNLTIDTAGANTSYLALFGYITGIDTEIKNLGVINVSITSGSTSYFIGGLCGYSYEGSIDNCYATGVINGGHHAGGLCGQNQSNAATVSLEANISNCYADVTVTGRTTLGGLCGTNVYSQINNSYATGDIVGEKNQVYQGGLCGTNYGGIVSDCYATGTVTGGGYSGGTGGLCGQNANGGTIRYCYATGVVNGLTSADYLGGLCGENSSGGIITNCYATGKVFNRSDYGYIGGLCGYQRNTGGSISYCYATGALTGDNNIGGLCGLRVGSNTITNSYWDTQTTGTTTSSGGTGKTTAQMHLQSTFTGWNFSTLWWMNEGRDYPKLIWQPVADLDNSGGVNLVDFVIMSRSWLAGVGDVNYNSICELSGDTTVNTADVAILAENWLTGL